ncbi:DUF2002 family protein [Pseudomonas mandelii]|uniref:HNH nuclease domain-containing protein n=1 Tax=Pseudomonas mandelii TaxID=75612 RepID=A0ABY0VUP6_9PSED|nr:DUF2002 family protein [Pseudomonas mandelii]TWS08789.1 DUF2002 family protein [Pseudomonas mandelii]SDU56438.1 Protein of unknown function [Pseudomonas mandelii]
MKLPPQQINMLLEKIGFTVIDDNKKKYIWQYKNGEPLFVNMEAVSGTSAVVIHPHWMSQVSELQAIPGVIPGADYVHHSNMNVFPKRLNRGIKPIPYGLPITLEDESSLLGLLGVLYPSLETKQVDSLPPASVSDTPPQESQFISHSELLAWFEQHTGQVLTWEQLQQAPGTVTISAKGIYKPKELVYALSISQRLDSPYSDQKPVYQENGSWHYSYAQEESPRGDSASLFTNLGLKKCMDDGVPVAVLVQLSKKPKITTYRMLGLAKVISWKDGFFTLESTTLAEDGIKASPTAEDPSSYSPTGVEDNRERTLREITKRQGQGAFRSGLLTAYEGRCAITGSSVKQVLEAAHITPFLGPETNHIGNGLLLRSDLHTLWDRGLIYLCEDLKLQLKPSLETSEYFDLAGKKIRARTGDAPGLSMGAVRAHREWCSSID